MRAAAAGLPSPCTHLLSPPACRAQLACLEADCAILDEIDSGLDIDALRDVAAAVNGLRQQSPAMGVLMVTHYKVGRAARRANARRPGTPAPAARPPSRVPPPVPPLPRPPPTRLQRLLDYIRPDHVHIMAEGRIATTGGRGLVDQLELEGYALLSPSA